MHLRIASELCRIVPEPNFSANGNLMEKSSQFGRQEGCVAKIFKRIKTMAIVATGTHFIEEKWYHFYLFYLCKISVSPLFDGLKIFAIQPSTHH